MILDPFGGSGTTLVVAKKLDRRFIGFELSKNYAKQTNARLKSTNVGDALSGSEDPMVTVAPTAKGRKLVEVQARKRNGHALKHTNGEAIHPTASETEILSR